MFLQCPLIFCCLLPFPLPSPVMEVPPQKSGSCWREIVPPMARHALGAAGQLLTTFAFHLLCRKGWFFPPPLPERSPQVLAKSSTFQCCPEEGPLWQVPLLCFQSPFHPTLMECQSLPSGSLGFHKFSLAHGYPPSFAFSRFYFPQLFGGGRMGAGLQTTLDLQLPLRSFPLTFICTDG